VLLTNDDGIGATGIEAIERAVSEVTDVTVVAPATDQSGVSRADSQVFDVEKRESGYVVQGTPADCVQSGVGWLETTFDMVISGCNDGPNLGEHRLTRSGTVAGAIEGAYLGKPGVAISVYDPPAGVREFYPDDYVEAGRGARVLTTALRESEWPFDFLNVNVPATAIELRVRITEPVSEYEITVSKAGDEGYHVWDQFRDPLVPAIDEESTDPVGTDRRAVADDEISVTPLCVGNRTPDLSAAESLGDRFHRTVGRDQQPVESYNFLPANEEGQSASLGRG
jgi:5'-nucleotidase